VSERSETSIVESWLARALRSALRASAAVCGQAARGQWCCASMACRPPPTCTGRCSPSLPGGECAASPSTCLGWAPRSARDFDYRWSALAKWLNAALDEIGIDRAHFVVHDIGGPISFEALRLAPGRARSITALDTIARPSRFRRAPAARVLARPLLGRAALAATGERQLQRALRRDCIAGPVPSEEVEPTTGCSSARTAGAPGCR